MEKVSAMKTVALFLMHRWAWPWTGWYTRRTKAPQTTCKPGGRRRIPTQYLVLSGTTVHDCAHRYHPGEPGNKALAVVAAMPTSILVKDGRDTFRRFVYGTLLQTRRLPKTDFQRGRLARYLLPG